MRGLKFYIIILLSLVSFHALSQELTNLKDAKPLAINGGVSANQVLYGITGIDNRRDPYSYFLSGSVNFNFYDVVNAPFTFTYSNQQANFQQPFNFNQFGISPSYKWIQTYFGYNAMSFSKYTLNGHMFLGAGVKLAPPGIFRFSAMYGRLQKAVEEDTLNKQVIPGYKRMGYGLSIGLEKEKNFIHLDFFKAKDEINSLEQTPVISGVLPMENLVIGINAGKSLGEKFAFTIEAASSALTRDLRASSITTEGNNFIWNTGIFNNKESTAYYNAINAQLKYTGNGISVGLGYERVDPEYRTLGAYYFNNDLENITVNSTKSFLSGKMNVNVNVGIQRNNLEDDKLSSMRNVVSSLNINYQVNSKLSLSGAFSNFNSYTHIKSSFETINQLTPYDNLDTLDFTMITTTANFNTSYSIGDVNNKEKKQNLNLNIAYQHSGNQQHNYNANTDFYSGNLSYSHNLIPKKMIVSSAFNFNYNKADTLIKTMTFGPTLSISKQFFEKVLKTTLSSSVNFSYNDGIMQNRIWNVRLIGTYTLKEKHNINLSLMLLNRKTEIIDVQEFTEFTGTLGYSFNF